MFDVKQLLRDLWGRLAPTPWIDNFELVTEREKNMTATIVFNNSNDRFDLVQRGVGIVGTYTRARDARRGAKRLGLVIS